MEPDTLAAELTLQVLDEEGEVVQPIQLDGSVTCPIRGRPGSRTP
jgi:hypothetical protein